MDETTLLQFSRFSGRVRRRGIIDVAGGFEDLETPRQTLVTRIRQESKMFTPSMILVIFTGVVVGLLLQGLTCICHLDLLRVCSGDDDANLFLSLYR